MKRKTIIILVIGLSLAILIPLGILVAGYFFPEKKDIGNEEAPSNLTVSRIESSEIVTQVEKNEIKNQSMGYLVVNLPEQGVVYVKNLDDPSNNRKNEESRFTTSSSQVIPPGYYEVYAEASDLKKDIFLETVEVFIGKETKLDIVFAELDKERRQQVPEEQEISTSSELEEQFNKYTLANPLLPYLPYKTEGYEIYLPDYFTYKVQVDLYPTVTFQQDSQKFRDEIDQYKSEINAWVESNGVDPETVEFNYVVIKPE
ncbi:hypothetical protein KKC60_02835, partial [Patescibacteria group bacterium]|nr:hypothetical protein [Patescibacteria group bacterium]